LARRLAAIVAVDIVGFSRLMAVDEDGTWVALNELRALIDPILESEGGRIVKSTGDGVLVEAPSVIGAVRAAIEVQQVVERWNRHRPSDKALRLRIGINLGDIIVADDGDVYGDGVNVAARLEGLADPGGISLSDSAYQQVRGRIDARFADRGEQQVKNIPTPVQVWAVLTGSDPADVDQDEREARLNRPGMLTTAVAIAAVLIGGAVFGIFTGGSPTPEDTTTTVDTTSVVVDTGNSGNGDPFGVPGSIWTASFAGEIVDVAGNETCEAGTPCPAVVSVLLADGTVAGVDARDGSDAWGGAFDIGLPAPVADAGELRASTGLQVRGERVYLVRAGTRLLYSLDLRDGSQKWRALTPFDSALGGPRLATDGVDTYVGYGLGIARLDHAGRVTWENPVAVTLLVVDVSAARTFVAAIDGRSVYGFDADTGTRRWELGPPSLAAPIWVHAQELEVASGSGRAFDRRILVTTERGELVVIGADDHEVRWRAEISRPPGSPPTDRVFVAGIDGEAMSLWMDTGDVDWVNDGVRLARSPVAANGLVHGISGSDLVTLNSRSGTEVRRVPLPGTPTTDLVVIGDQIILGIGHVLVAFPAAG
jgi:class 3 adenylate cyclase/outer membrane protein assembly factor BamB